VRAFLSIGALVVLTLALLPLQWLAVRFKWPLRRVIPTFYHGLVCRILGVRITIIGGQADVTPLLIVSNHVSWLDISVLTAVAPVVFAAKREVASWPMFGLLARLQRSVFVDRERRQKTRDVNRQIARRLVGGDAVLLFAEGTSSDGNRVLTFRTALIGAARDAVAQAGHVECVWIQPLSIAYTSVHGLPLARANRSAVAWKRITAAAAASISRMQCDRRHRHLGPSSRLRSVVRPQGRGTAPRRMRTRHDSCGVARQGPIKDRIPSYPSWAGFSLKRGTGNPSFRERGPGKVIPFRRKILYEKRSRADFGQQQYWETRELA
jgi:lyso-ornithine lipid O-acyltransferase